MIRPGDNSVRLHVRPARRRRDVYSDEPYRLYQPLGWLSIAPDGAALSCGPAAEGPGDRTPRAASHTAGSDRPGKQLFTRLVASHLDGPVLRYSNRLRLLGIARGMGLAAFEANLLIAAVQHERSRRRRCDRGIGYGVVFGLAIQSAILALLGWIALA